MNNFKIFLQSYLRNLSNSILFADLESMDKAAKLILSTIKKKKLYTSVEMVDLRQLQIITCVIS